MAKKSAGGRKGPTPKQQAAAQYKATFNAEPPKRMTMKAMKTAVSQEGLRKSHAAAKAQQAASERSMWGGGSGLRPNAVRKAIASPEGQKKMAEIKTSLQGASDGLKKIGTKIGELNKPRTQDVQVRETVPKTRGMAPAARRAALEHYARNRSLWAMSSPERARFGQHEARLRGLPEATAPKSKLASARPGEIMRQVGREAMSVRDRNMALAGLRDRLPSARTVNTAVMAAGVAVAAGRGYQQAKAEGKSTGEAIAAGAMNAAVPAAIAAAPVIAKGAGHVASGMFALGGELIKGSGGVFTDVMLDFAMQKAALGAGAIGVAAKGVQIGAQVIGRVAPAAMAAYGAYQGAKEDQNMTRGAARGAIRSFDPTAIFMQRSLSERGFDAMFGRATPRVAAGQAQQFAAADASFKSRQQAEPQKRAGEFYERTRQDPRSGKTINEMVRNPNYGKAPAP